MSSDHGVAKPAVISLEMLSDTYGTDSTDWFTPALFTGTLIFVIACVIVVYYTQRWRPLRLRQERQARLEAVPYSELDDEQKRHYAQHALKLLAADTRSPSMWLEVQLACAGSETKTLQELAQCVDYWQLRQLYERYPESTGSLNAYLGQVYYQCYKPKKFKAYH